MTMSCAPVQVTAPFDPICPLCFIREWFQSLGLS